MFNSFAKTQESKIRILAGAVIALCVILGFVSFILFKHIQLTNYYMDDVKTRIHVVKMDLSELKDNVPTFDEVDTISKNNSGGVVYVDRSELDRVYDKQPNVDLSQPAPAPKRNEITYIDNKSGKKVVAGDSTCGIDENRLHWELFAMPAPGCENTPTKGL